MVTVKVREGHSELITQLVSQSRVIEHPWLYMKLPWPIQASTSIDRRRRVCLRPSKPRWQRRQTQRSAAVICAVVGRGAACLLSSRWHNGIG